MNGNVVEQAQSLRRKSRAIVEIDAQSLTPPRTIDCPDEKRNRSDRRAENNRAHTGLQRPLFRRGEAVADEQQACECYGIIENTRALYFDLPPVS